MNRVLTQVRKTLLSEAKVQLDPQALKTITYYTKQGHLSPALAIGFKMLRLRDEEEMATALSSIYNRLDGVLIQLRPHPLDAFAIALKKRLADWAKDRLSPEDFNTFMGAFKE